MTIGVSDASCHRIPNKLLLILSVLLLTNMFVHTTQEVLWAVFLQKSIALTIAFVFALILHLLRVMAPGDVKFIAVLGFFLGTGELVNYLYYVCLITAFVGSMYWLMNRLHMAHKTDVWSRTSLSSATGMVVAIQLSQYELKRKVAIGKDLTYMPFAPILIIGLALHQYYS